jgi:hypothetical protein
MFRWLANLFGNLLGMFGSGAAPRSPEALLEAEKENLRRQVAQFNQGLAAHATLCNRLMAQTKTLEAEEQQLKAKTAATLRAGNRDAAGQYALRLQTVSRELAENREQLKQAQDVYTNLVRSRDTALAAAQARIAAVKNTLTDLKVQQSMAELSNLASGMAAPAGGPGDTLDRLRVMVEEERDRAAGKARVAHDLLEAGELRQKEAETNAQAERALAEFAARQGIDLDPEAAKGRAATETGK